MESGPLIDLPAAVEVALYRVAVEAVHNTVRHAAATTCVVHLGRAPGRVVLTVSDDGVGPIADGRWGLGQRTMRERIDELGGRLAITRRPTGGTEVAAVVPVAAASADPPRPAGGVRS